MPARAWPGQPEKACFSAMSRGTRGALRPGMPKPKRNLPKPSTKKRSKSPEKTAAPAPEPASAPDRPRGTDDALPLRVAVLEDVMKRAHVQLARRLDDLEKRLPAPS